MKRKSRADIPALAAPKRQPRQDPVSCESCRKKKLKCDRQFPCSSCSTRGLACSYEPPTTISSGKPRAQAAGLPPENVVSLAYQMNQEPRSNNPASRHKSQNEPLMTADWLENIVMGHHVPTALPPTLREEVSQQRHIGNRLRPQRCSETVGKLLAIIHSDHPASRENPMTIHLPPYLPPRTETISLFRYYCNFVDYLYHLIVGPRVEESIEDIYEMISRNEPVDLRAISSKFPVR